MASTVSVAKGTDPINNVGFRRITSRRSNFQQSPTCGRRPTGATSLHHLLTPTSARPARSARRIEVTLGASETMRSGARDLYRGMSRLILLRCAGILYPERVAVRIGCGAGGT